MGRKKHYTQEDIDYIHDKWGEVNIAVMARRLKRTISAVRQKAYKLGLGAIKDGDGIMTCSQLLGALNMSGGWTHYKYQLVKRGLPIYRKRIINKYVDKIKLDDFWKWAEQNKDAINWSRVEKNILGIEPAWVDERRRIHFYNKSDYQREWSALEDAQLRSYVERGYTYKEIAERINRTGNAIRRRCYEMYLPYPKREKAKPWTSKELIEVTQMHKDGYHICNIAKHLNRSEHSIRGKLDWLARRSVNDAQTC